MIYMHRMKAYLVVIVSVLMLMSAFAVFQGTSPASKAVNNSPTSAITSQGTTISNLRNTPAGSSATASVHQGPGINMENHVMSTLKEKGVQSKFVYLPNFNAKTTLVNGKLQGPGYGAAPAPMGIGDYGLIRESNGSIGTYNYSTSSIEGTLNISSASLLSMVTDAPQSFSVQLNAIMNNVTLFGNSAYTFWTQNVLFYSARTHQLVFLSNIWNFSSPAFYMSPNVFSKAGGNLIAPVFYYGQSATLNVSFPFQVNLYLNSSVSRGGNDTIYFNYTLYNKTSSGTWMTSSGMFDFAQFNSTYGQASGYRAPRADFFVSGSTITPTGFIPYDAEIMIGGPGGGSSATFNNINATMKLKVLNDTSGTYSNVKAAYDIGSETGETSVGVSVYYKHASAFLRSGPSFVLPMWNLSKPSKEGYYMVKGSVTPGSAYMFANLGNKTNNMTATWAPVQPSGSFAYYLMPGNYSFQTLMSFYDPYYFNVSGTNSTTPITENLALVQNFSRGMYTPLQAYSNSSLAALVAAIGGSGNGTASNPYVIDGYHDQWINVTGTPVYVPEVNINPLFSAFNDYVFPIFYGVLLANINSTVEITNMPSMEVQYPSSVLPILNYWGLPSMNYLGYEFYNDSNIILINNDFISGWYSINFAFAALSGTAGYVPLGSVLLWNTTHSLIAHNTFYSMGVSLAVYNPNYTMADNTIWGNQFLQYSGIAQSQYVGGISGAETPNGIDMWSSGNTIYNNYFDVAVTAYSPGANASDPYTGFLVNYTDTWNVSKQAASNIHMVDSVALYGSILGQQYQGGNYWWNYYGIGKKPYNNTISGVGTFIQSGMDMVPLVEPKYSFVAVESGLPYGTSWNVSLVNPVQVNALGVLGNVVFSGTSNTDTVSIPVTNGTYMISVTETITTPSNISMVVSYPQVVTILGSSVEAMVSYVNVNFASVTITESGLPAGAQWGVSYVTSSVPYAGLPLVSGTKTTTSPSLTISGLLQGANYTFTPVSVANFTSQAPYTLTMINVSNSYDQAYTPYTYSVSFSEVGLPSGTAWSITFAGHNYTSSSPTIVVKGVVSGSYAYSVGTVTGYSPAVGSGTLTVKGSSSVTITFVQTTFTVTFKETGLASGTTWNITFNGQNYSSSTDTITITNVAQGTYSYTIGNVSGYASPGSSSISVNGNSVINVAFAKIPRAPGMSAAVVGYIIGGIIGGLIVGGVVVYAITRKPKA